MNIIEIEHLRRDFGKVRAVDDITFSVRKGEFFSFLGVNGAGKSTTIAMITGTLPPTSGTVRVCGRALGEDTAFVKRRLGVVFQGSSLDPALTGEENLRCRAAFYGITGRAFARRLEELDALLDLGGIVKRPVGKLSGGQRRRMDLARALVHGPEILVLDEPTTGLDPRTRTLLWQTVRDLRADRSLTVFLTTHYMEEAADSDRVVIIDGGRILADDTPLALKETFTKDFVTLYHVREEDVRSLGYPYERAGEGWRIAVENTAEAAELIRKNAALFSDFEVVKGKMDDVFLAVTGKRSEGDTL